MPHPFDRYAALTDLTLLNDFSGKPLRKSIRVNTLKISVADFTKWAKEKNWQLTPVPWCPEAFFIDREDRTEALGKDLLHLLGATYMQEAASMLPVALLDPQPGEVILDMSAAPGSKTTQIAARQQGRGVVIANDMQDKRLQTLRAALQRCGVTNAIMTKRVGQWFARHMTGRFDRVLIDAPCTAQGTIRKDETALTYSSEMSIGKMAKLQHELLESAIHVAKIGGRIVYSTCTLTPEENEEVVLNTLNKFSDQLRCVPVEELDLPRGALQQAIDDSHVVQKDVLAQKKNLLPLFRLWPQTYDTEGFFCAVFEKTGPTHPVERMDWIKRKEQPITRYLQREITDYLRNHFDAPLIHDNEVLLDAGEHLLIATEDSVELRLPLSDYATGLPFGKRIRDGAISLDHDFITLRGAEAQSSVVELDEGQLRSYLKGGDISCDQKLMGQVIVRFKGIPVGSGKARDGQLKNNLPRWMVQMA